MAIPLILPPNFFMHKVFGAFAILVNWSSAISTPEGIWEAGTLTAWPLSGSLVDWGTGVLGYWK